MKIKLIPIILAAALSVGCSSTNANKADSQTQNTVETEERPNVAISLPIQTEHSEKLAKELTNKLYQKGCNIILRYAENNPKTQQQQINDLIEQNISCLVVEPVNGNELNLTSCGNKDISVINIENPIANGKYADCFVSYNYTEAGRMTGSYIVNKTAALSSVQTIEFIMGQPTPASEDFLNGVMESVKPMLQSGAYNCRSGRTAIEQCTTTAADTETIVKDFAHFLSGYYLKNDLNIFVAGSDSIAQGCAAHMLNNGFKALPIIAGLGGDDSAMEGFKQGTFSSTVFLDTAKEAEQCAEIASLLINGEDITKIATDEKLLGETNVPALILSPTQITKENYSKTLTSK